MTHPTIALTDSDKLSHYTVSNSLELSCELMSPGPHAWCRGHSALWKVGRPLDAVQGGMTGQGMRMLAHDCAYLHLEPHW